MVVVKAEKKANGVLKARLWAPLDQHMPINLLNSMYTCIPLNARKDAIHGSMLPPAEERWDLGFRNR